MATLELLRRVRKTLVEKGWIQGNMHSENGYCLLGAISHVRSTIMEGNKLRDVIASHIHGSYDARHKIITWNDKAWRRRWQVFNLLDRAIAKLEAQRALRRIKRAAQHAKAVRTSFERVFQPVRVRGEKCSERK